MDRLLLSMVIFIMVGGLILGLDPVFSAIFSEDENVRMIEQAVSNLLDGAKPGESFRVLAVYDGIENHVGIIEVFGKEKNEYYYVEVQNNQVINSKPMTKEEVLEVIKIGKEAAFNNDVFNVTRGDFMQELINKFKHEALLHSSISLLHQDLANRRAQILQLLSF